MLSKILKKSDCADCRFCCAFRQESQWETPIFESGKAKKLLKAFPNAKFKKTGKNSSTLDLSGLYTDDEDYEAKCFFLSENGCILSESDKPFDCSIWPFRIMYSGDAIVLALTPTCKKINEYDIKKIKEFVITENLHIKIFDYAKNHSDIIKEYKSNFPIIFKYEK